MIQTLIGQKLDQTQSFLENGTRVPVTEIAVTENVVLQAKTLEKDMYSAVQLGAGIKKKPTRAVAGHAKKAGVGKAPLKVREVRMDVEDLPEVGSSISVDAVFKPGDIVQVTGTSKGKGFAGGVKRHGFKGGPKTHGQSDRHRTPGSIGQGTTPGRVYKGKRMAGRMGTDTVTVKNLTIVDVDSATGRLFVSGLVPGHKNAWVVVTKIGEMKKFVPLIAVAEKKAAEEKAVSEAAEAASTEMATDENREEVKKVSSPDSGATKEVASAAAEGELKAPASEEKREMISAAEENIAEEKKTETESELVEEKEDNAPINTDNSGEPKEEQNG